MEILENLPRARVEYTGALNKKFCHLIRKNNHSMKDYSNPMIRDIARSYNEKVKDYIMENRDGVELAQSLGRLFIVSYKSKAKYKDQKSSKEEGREVYFKNPETEGMNCKIMHTVYRQKYVFLNSRLYGFKAMQQFSRKVSGFYRDNYKKYIFLNDIRKFQELDNKLRYKEMFEQERIDKLKTYNEFEL